MDDRVKPERLGLDGEHVSEIYVKWLEAMVQKVCQYVDNGMFGVKHPDCFEERHGDEQGAVDCRCRELWLRSLFYTVVPFNKTVHGRIEAAPGGHKDRPLCFASRESWEGSVDVVSAEEAIVNCRACLQIMHIYKDAATKLRVL